MRAVAGSATACVVLVAVLVVAFLVVAGSRGGAPVNESRSEVREREDRAQVGPVGADLVEAESAMVLEAQGDPVPVGGVGAGEGVDVAAGEMRQQVLVAAIRADHRDVG